MQYIHILDTTIILHDAESIFSFPDSQVIIPLEVIESVDRFKREMNELGKNAREFNRCMDRLRKRGSLTEGIHLDNGGLLKIAVDLSYDNSHRERGRNDKWLLNHAIKLRDEHPEKEIVIVSKDLNLRLKADALGLKAQAYDKDRFDEVLQYDGFHTLELSPEEIAEYENFGSLQLNSPLRPNEFICLKERGKEKVKALGRIASHDSRIVIPLKFASEEISGLRPLNIEQTFVMEALLDDKIKLITLQGAAGTGKTLLAVAAGLHQVLRDFTYNKVLVARPTIPMGKDIGFLPGDIKEKMMPWMQPIYDALDLIKTLDRRSRKPILPANLMEMEEIQIEPLTYIRGRSIPDQFLIIDEAQNLSPLEAKTIITRVGKNSKIILTGDVQQIDHPYMDSHSNGLAYVAGRFRDSHLSAHIKLRKGERSELAEAAVQLL